MNFINASFCLQQEFFKSLEKLAFQKFTKKEQNSIEKIKYDTRYLYRASLAE